MWKLFYKTFLVSVLCGSLMLLDFSYKGIQLNAARAESVKTEKINDQDLMGTLAMTAAGTIASRLYTYMPPTTDIMIAAAGGAAFIGGEVLAYFKLKEVMKGMEVEITRDAKGNVNKEQLESLERLKKSYQEAKKTAETKKTLQMAAAAAFAAAGVMAYMMATQDMTALTTCTTGITTGLSALTTVSSSVCAPLVAGTYTAAEGARCNAEVAACTTAMTKYQAGVMKYEMARQASGPSMQGLSTATSLGTALTAELSALNGSCTSYTAAAASAMAGTCTPLVPQNKITMSGGTNLGMVAGVSPKIFQKKLFSDEDVKKTVIAELKKPDSMLASYVNSAFNMIFPPAEAALFSAMGIASSAAVTYVLMTSKSLAAELDFFLLIPQKRAIAWGILAGLTFAATSATNNVIKQIEANISKIDQILNNMYQNANGATGTQVASKNPAVQTTLKPGSAIQFNANDYSDVDLKAEGGEALPCFTGNDPKNCKSFDETVSGTPSFANLNLESQKQLSSILATANGLNGSSKISGSTLKNGESLAKSANALKAAYDKAAKKSAEDLKKAGSKFNIDEQSKKLSGGIEKAVRDNLKKVNATPSSMMASMYGGKGAINSSTASSTPDKAKDDTADKKVPVPAGAVVDISAPAGEKSDLGLTGMNTGDKELSAEELAKLNEAQAAAAGKETIDQYDLKGDITKDSSSSIFELISNRYQHSAYPRLFKVKEPVAEAPVNK